MLLRNLLLICMVFLYNFGFAQLQITNPTNQQKFADKTTIPITWKVGSNTKSVQIEYLKGVYSQIITSSTPNDGQFDWDIHPLELDHSRLFIKITDTDNPENYTVSQEIIIEPCNIEVDIAKPTTDFCVGERVTFINKTRNATSFDWIINDKTVSTAKDFVFTPTNLEPVFIKFKASNSSCYDYATFDIKNKPSITDGGICSGETVIEEMMIIDTGESMMMTASVPVVITDPITVLAFRITHELENSKEFFSWDWSANTIPGFSMQNIDFSDKNKVTVTWTSSEPKGTTISGELYSLVYEITNDGLVDPPVPVLRTISDKRRKGRVRGSGKVLPVKPTTIGKTNVKYNKVIAISKTGMTGVKVKTSGVLITKDEIIILEP